MKKILALNKSRDPFLPPFLRGVGGIPTARLMILAVLALSLCACSVFGGGTAQPLPTVVLGTAGAPTPRPSGGSQASPTLGGVTASGKVAPLQQAQLAFAQGGNLQLLAAAGDQVKAGQVLARLAGGERLAAAVAAANLELLSAQQAYDSLNTGAAQARAQAQQTLADAAKALKDAQDNRYRKNLARVSQATIDQVQADLIIAKDKLKDNQENYDKYVNRPENDLQRAQAFSMLAAAQQKVDQIQWNLDWLIGRPDTLEVQQADAAIAVAQANLAAAQRQFDRLKDGPDPDALALTQARIQNAKAQLAAGQAALTDLELKAPFDGTVTQTNVHMGEWVLPGQPVLLLVDLNRLRVETTDLSERDVPQVAVGQSASVTVKALNQTISGKVAEISPLADVLGGDVVYKATIELDSAPPGLRAGMSVDVTFGGK